MLEQQPAVYRKHSVFVALIRPMRLTLAILVLLATSFLSCSPRYDGQFGLTVHNDLGVTVRMTYVVNGVEASLAEDTDGDIIRPGEEKRFRLDLYEPANGTGCTTGDLVARSEQGREVARIRPPVCAGGGPRLRDWPPATP